MGKSIFLEKKSDDFIKALKAVLEFSNSYNIEIERNKEIYGQFSELMNVMMRSLVDLDSEFVPYSEISQTVFTLSKSDGYDADSMEYDITRMSKYFVEFFDGATEEQAKSFEGIETQLTKMMSNIKLAKTQVNFLYNTQDSDIKKLIAQNDELEKKSEEISRDFDE